MGRRALKITADTNLLVRAITTDDQKQAAVATTELQTASLVALPIPALCEVAWVLGAGYSLKRPEIAAALRGILSAQNTVTDDESALAGLAALDAGGDFADGVIAFEGSALGGTEFVSFDRRAVMMLKNQGRAARLLA